MKVQTQSLTLIYHATDEGFTYAIVGPRLHSFGFSFSFGRFHDDSDIHVIHLIQMTKMRLVSRS